MGAAQRSIAGGMAGYYHTRRRTANTALLFEIRVVDRRDHYIASKSARASDTAAFEGAALERLADLSTEEASTALVRESRSKMIARFISSKVGGFGSPAAIRNLSAEMKV
jgi:hypothetical protein